MSEKPSNSLPCAMATGRTASRRRLNEPRSKVVVCDSCVAVNRSSVQSFSSSATTRPNAAGDVGEPDGECTSGDGVAADVGHQWRLRDEDARRCCPRVTRSRSRRSPHVCRRDRTRSH